MKAHVERNAFYWMKEVRAAQKYGTEAAKAFAEVMRAEARNNDFKCSAGLRPGQQPRVIAGDSQFTDWTVSISLEALIVECMRDAGTDGLNNLAVVLERTLKKVRRLQAQRAVPDSGTAGG